MFPVRGIIRTNSGLARLNSDVTERLHRRESRLQVSSSTGLEIGVILSASPASDASLSPVARALSPAARKCSTERFQQELSIALGDQQALTSATESREAAVKQVAFAVPAEEAGRRNESKNPAKSSTGIADKADRGPVRPQSAAMRTSISRRNSRTNRPSSASPSLSASAARLTSTSSAPSRSPSPDAVGKGIISGAMARGLPGDCVDIDAWSELPPPPTVSFGPQRRRAASASRRTDCDTHKQTDERAEKPPRVLSGSVLVSRDVGAAKLTRPLSHTSTLQSLGSILTSPSVGIDEDISPLDGGLAEWAVMERALLRIEDRFHQSVFLFKRSAQSAVIHKNIITELWEQLQDLGDAALESTIAHDISAYASSVGIRLVLQPKRFVKENRNTSVYRKDIVQQRRLQSASTLAARTEAARAAKWELERRQQLDAMRRVVSADTKERIRSPSVTLQMRRARAEYAQLCEEVMAQQQHALEQHQQEMRSRIDAYPDLYSPSPVPLPSHEQPQRDIFTGRPFGGTLQQQHQQQPWQEQQEQPPRQETERQSQQEHEQDDRVIFDDNVDRPTAATTQSYIDDAAAAAAEQQQQQEQEAGSADQPLHLSDLSPPQPATATTTAPDAAAAAAVATTRASMRPPPSRPRTAVASSVRHRSVHERALAEAVSAVKHTLVLGLDSWRAYARLCELLPDSFLDHPAVLQLRDLLDEHLSSFTPDQRVLDRAATSHAELVCARIDPIWKELHAALFGDSGDFGTAALTVSERAASAMSSSVARSPSHWSSHTDSVTQPHAVAAAAAAVARPMSAARSVLIGGRAVQTHTQTTGRSLARPATAMR